MSSKLVLKLGAALVLTAVAKAQTGLANASLEQLLNTPVTSVSKKQEALGHTAASVFVIGQDDIRRSGAETIPDLLRMVPGVQVAQMDASDWAVSIRGFNQRYANKLLVLIDGRSLYAPAYGGVYWDHVDVPLSDIERIEVIRGPGASVWGANAVNGVINIITKPAKSTTGGQVELGANTDGGAEALARYGSSAGPSGAYRVYGESMRFGGNLLPGGSEVGDQWLHSRGGFRSDWDLTPNDNLTVEGSGFSNRGSELRYSGYLNLPGETTYRPITDAAGADFLARWRHSTDGGGEGSVQVYYDHFRRDESGQPEIQTVFDIEAQRHLTLGRQDLVGGVEYRAQNTNLAPGYRIGLNPPIDANSLAAAFLQDEIRVTSALWLTVGSRFEYNSYTKFEFEPNLRLAWAPSGSHTLWTSASRAVRQPTRLETEVAGTLDSTPLAPGLVATFPLSGNPKFQSEELRDLEAGYRGQWAKSWSFDASAFYSRYRRLETFETGNPMIIPGAVTEIALPLSFGNKAHATDYGGEASLNWSMNSRLRFSAGYSLLFMNVKLDPDSTDTYSVNADTYAPRNTVQIRSTAGLTRRLEWNCSVYWTEATINRKIPSHVRLDSRLEYRLSEFVSLSLNGQNLLSPGFMEFGDSEEFVGTLPPRTLMGKVTWRF